MRDKSVKRSAAMPIILHGVKIKKLPVAKYLAAIEAMSAPISTLLYRLFPGMSGRQLTAFLAKMTDTEVRSAVSRIITKAPAEAVRIIGQLLDIPDHRLFDEDADDALTLNQLLDIVEAAWRVNDLSDFFTKGRKLVLQLTAQQTTSTGSKT